jgi:hypothetical protein
VARYKSAVIGILKSPGFCYQIRPFSGDSDTRILLDQPVATGVLEYFRADQLAAWLGLVPRQYSTGGKSRLGRITKRGDVYLRTLLIHGARSVLRRLQQATDAKSRWAAEVKNRRGYNKAVVALAGKHARIVWAILATGESYCPKVSPA